MLKPRLLKFGDTLGIFTPSSPAYDYNPEMFENGLKNLKQMGFKIKLGELTASRASEGYRTASGSERALEMMQLIEDPDVQGLIATDGGATSNSLIPYLDFKRIRDARKMICGFSDITSLHLAISHYSQLQTFYGPTVMRWLGEWPDGDPISIKYFLDAVCNHTSGVRPIHPPDHWSRHQRSWENGDWKSLPRLWHKQQDWRIVNKGEASGPILPACFNIFMSSCGTKYFPDLRGKILMFEDTEATLSRTERNLRQLSLIGVFDEISGLIISKPENYDQQNAPFNYESLFQEIIGPRNYPIVCDFDCGHTLPLITMPLLAPAKLLAFGNSVEFSLLDGSVE